MSTHAMQAAITGPGLAMIAAERARQIAVKGYTPEHDTEHRHGELIEAAAAYALAAANHPSAHETWPFEWLGFKPGPKPLDSLVKAGALIAAEIDRLIAQDGEAG